MRIVHLQWVNMCPYNFFVSGPKYTNFFSNARRILVDDTIYLLSIAAYIPEIFVVKLS